MVSSPAPPPNLKSVKIDAPIKTKGYIYFCHYCIITCMYMYTSTSWFQGKNSTQPNSITAYKHMIVQMESFEGPLSYQKVALTVQLVNDELA